MSKYVLPIPSFFDPNKVDQVWKVPYEERAKQAREWATQHGISPATNDRPRVALMIIDAQNTFCIPGFELFVGGRSGTGAVDDNRRLVEFIYRNLGDITTIYPTMDTHTAMQIFHATFWVNDEGEHPGPYTMITVHDVESGKWMVNPGVTGSVLGDYPALQRYALSYVQALQKQGRYELTIWPYHAMLGGIGHALVASVEEAVFFHTIARSNQASNQVKGGNPLTEFYSVLGPEVRDNVNRAQHNTRFIEALLRYDAILIAGQAKSHCVAWTIDDLLTEILAGDPNLAKKVFLIEDATSPVVVPGIDFTDHANAAFERFRKAGMHIITTADAVHALPIKA